MSSGAAAINEALRSKRARRHERTDALMAKLRGGAGSPTVDTPPFGERLRTLEAEREAAIRSGNDEAVDRVEGQLDQLFEDARAERTTAAGGDEPAPSFDGGVQGRRTVAPAGRSEETASQLLARSLMQSRVEREGRRSARPPTIA